MNVAFLFNSNHPSLGGYYGPPVMDLILSAGVLQNLNRHMRVSVGDILTYGAVPSRRLEELCRSVYQPVTFGRLKRASLEAVFTTATVYCWLFQNMTEKAAQELHDRLSKKDSYLGAMDVDFANPLHLALFRNSLVEAYRISGLNCSVFFTMSENEDPDIVVRDGFVSHGFTVSYEDRGARRTVFDNYDTLEHFKRVDSFKAIFAKLPGLTSDDASDLAHNLEELHPKLFDAFAAAARTLDRAETEEDYAQAALSGRRLLEKTADYLFPPRPNDWNGRKVGRAQYKNRLWAYTEKALLVSGKNRPETLTRLGKEADRLVDLFNAGLHADPSRSKVELAFRDLVVWFSELINIDPGSGRNPYLAYQDELLGFFKSAIKLRDADEV